MRPCWWRAQAIRSVSAQPSPIAAAAAAAAYAASKSPAEGAARRPAATDSSFGALARLVLEQPLSTAEPAGGPAPLTAHEQTKPSRNAQRTARAPWPASDEVVSPSSALRSSVTTERRGSIASKLEILSPGGLCRIGAEKALKASGDARCRYRRAGLIEWSPAGQQWRRPSCASIANVVLVDAGVVGSSGRHGAVDATRK